MNFVSENTGITRADQMQHTISVYPVPDLHMAIKLAVTGFLFPRFQFFQLHIAH